MRKRRSRFRNTLKRLAFCLSVCGFVSPPIREALSSDALERNIGTHRIVDAKFDAVVLAEIEFSQIALQVLLAAALIRADHAALEDREEAFERVGVNVTVCDVRLVVIDALVLGKARAH